MSDQTNRFGLRYVVANQAGADVEFNRLTSFMDALGNMPRISGATSSTTAAPVVGASDYGKMWMWVGNDSPTLDAGHEWAGLDALNTIQAGDLFVWTPAGWAHIQPDPGMVAVLAGDVTSWTPSISDADWTERLPTANVFLVYTNSTSVSTSRWVPLGALMNHRFGFTFFNYENDNDAVVVGYRGDRPIKRRVFEFAMPAQNTTQDIAHGLTIREVLSLRGIAQDRSDAADHFFEFVHDPDLIELTADGTNVKITPRVASVARHGGTTTITNYDDSLVIMEYVE